MGKTHSEVVEDENSTAVQRMVDDEESKMGGSRGRTKGGVMG